MLFVDFEQIDNQLNPRKSRMYRFLNAICQLQEQIVPNGPR